MPEHTTFNISSFSTGDLSAGLTLSNPSTWYPINSNGVGGLNLGQLPDATLSVSKYVGPGDSVDLFEGKITSLMTVPLAAPEPGTLSIAAFGVF